MQEKTLNNEQILGMIAILGGFVIVFTVTVFILFSRWGRREAARRRLVRQLSEPVEEKID